MAGESEDTLRGWQADERLERIIATALHDIRNPLNTASLQAQLLVKQHGKDLEAEPLGIAAEIPRQLAKARKVLDGIEKFIGVLFSDSNSDLVPLDEALDSALRNLEPELRSSNGRLERSPLPVVRGDSAQLAEVFKQLLANALRFGGGPDSVIFITCASSESGFRVSIRDTGCGFEQEYAEQIFQPFRRLHDHNTSGAGLGLALCREVLKRHGGRIWAESKLRGGSVFHLDFPSGRELVPRAEKTL